MKILKNLSHQTFDDQCLIGEVYENTQKSLASDSDIRDPRTRNRGSQRGHYLSRGDRKHRPPLHASPPGQTGESGADR